MSGAAWYRRAMRSPRLVALASLASLALTLAACGSSSPTPKSGAGTAAPATGTPDFKHMCQRYDEVVKPATPGDPDCAGAYEARFKESPEVVRCIDACLSNASVTDDATFTACSKACPAK